MSEKLSDDLYQIMKIVESHNHREKFEVELIRPYLNEYIKVITVPQNHYIVREDEIIKKVYYVITGLYCVTRFSENGKINVQDQRRAPQFIGVDRAVDRHIESPSNSLALKTCIVLEIHQDYFVECLKENGNLAVMVIKNITAKLAKVSMRSDSRRFNDSRKQLMFYIYQYWKENNTGHTLCEIREKNGQIADDIGISERTLYRAINCLKEEMLISVKKGYIVVTKEQIEKIKEYLQ